MEAATPLLVPSGDMQEEGVNRHKVKQTRTLNGLPDIPPSSVKGMIRSAFEAMTNSRFGEFVDHDQKLAFRQPAKDGLFAFPARVSDDGESIDIFAGRDKPVHPGRAGVYLQQTGELAGTWIFIDQIDAYNAKNPEQKIEHGGQIEFASETLSHRNNFTYRRVTAFRKCDFSLPEDQRLDQIGYLYRSEKTKLNSNKHYERVFVEFGKDHNKITLPLPDSVKRYWKNLLNNSIEAHADEDSKDFAAYIRSPEDWRELQPGVLCYVRLVSTPSSWEVALAQPVQIGSQLHPDSPLDLLDPSLRPAIDIDALSPADRVFGWVHESGSDSKISAYAGAVRFGAVKCLSSDALEDLGKGQTLPIMDRPKTQQSRFYVGQDTGRTIEPLKSGSSKQDVQYKSVGGRALRGRKVFPHQGGFKEPTRSLPGKQNQTVKNRVRAGSKFEFTLHVRNLSEIELGALLHLLSLNEGRASGESTLFNKIGGGKPFGFGSVKLDINWEHTRLAIGTDFATSLSGLTSVPQTTVEILREIAQRFQEAVRTQSYYKAFKIACQGYTSDQAVHYPMISPGAGEGEDILKWFVENERMTETGRGLSLPKLVNDSGGQLPAHPPRQNRR
jgi:CRISPR-associated protein (TIGR03986 family)